MLPSLYGEGYEAINEGLSGNLNFVFDNSIFYDYHDQALLGLVLLFGITMFKVVATSLTFRAGE